jgi:signal peptidase II
MKLEHTKIVYATTAFSVVLANYLRDRITKIFAFEFLRGKKEIKVIGDYIVLLYTENGGAFLSLGTNWNLYVKYLVFLVLPILICLLLIYYLITKEKYLRKIIIMSSIIGGGLGNLIDRLFNEFKVIDFLNFGIGDMRTGILNVADLSVTFGIIILVITEVVSWKHTKRRVRDKGRKQYGIRTVF